MTVRVDKQRMAIIAANEISEIRTYTLGGYEQKVLIEGKKRSNPIVIFLHGGPGSPIPFCEGCRGMFPDITERVTMVYWDQLGCGINNHPIDDSFTIEHFAAMTVDLIRHLKHDFPDNTVNLFGVSWGSVLAAKAAALAPESLHKVMIYGQVLKQNFFNDEVYDVLEHSKMPPNEREKLSKIKQASTHDPKDLRRIVGWIQKYTEGYQCKKGGKMQLGKIIRGLLTSPDYSFRDFTAIIINGYRKNKSLMTELLDIDLSQTLQRITVPYLILQGETDIVTSTKMIRSFVETAGNDNLMFRLVENSGHMPGAHAMDVIINTEFGFLKDSTVNSVSIE